MTTKTSNFCSYSCDTFAFSSLLSPYGDMRVPHWRQRISNESHTSHTVHMQQWTDPLLCQQERNQPGRHSHPFPLCESHLIITSTDEMRRAFQMFDVNQAASHTNYPSTLNKLAFLLSGAVNHPHSWGKRCFLRGPTHLVQGKLRPLWAVWTGGENKGSRSALITSDFNFMKLEQRLSFSVLKEK